MKFIKAAILIMTITLSLNVSVSATAQAGAVTSPPVREMNDPQTAVELEGPSLPAPAAAQHAENLAAVSANSARAEILKNQQRVADAVAALSEAMNSGNQTMIDGAQAHYNAALRSLDGAISDVTGITSDKISAMRSSGMGLGKIAYELGINLTALGFDHPIAEKVDELQMATARNVETGLSVWHGTRFSGKGMGLDRAESKKGVESGTEDKRSDSGGDIIAGIGAVLDR